MSIQSIRNNFMATTVCVCLILLSAIIQNVFPTVQVIKIPLAILCFIALFFILKNQRATRIYYREIAKRLGNLETTDYEQKFYLGKLVAAGSSIIMEQEGNALMRKIREQFAVVTKSSAGYLLLYNQNQNHYEWEGGISLSHLKLKTYPNPILPTDRLMGKILSNMNLVLIHNIPPLLSGGMLHIRDDVFTTFMPQPDCLITIKMKMKDSILGILFLFVTKIQALDIEKNILLFQSFLNQATLALGSAIQREFAINDRMTMMYNHGYFVSRLREEIATCERAKGQRKFSLLMMDIDHFKKFNDTYGHQVGDFVLIESARIYKSCVRYNDVVARYGGEEFTVILPETALKEAVLVAEKIRLAIETNAFKTEKGDLKVTVSIGCCEWHLGPPVMTAESIIKNADVKLYESKGKGRNQVSF
jgi:diguanylate cyclase (GGDEF)-like protein